MHDNEHDGLDMSIVQTTCNITSLEHSWGVRAALLLHTSLSSKRDTGTPVEAGSAARTATSTGDAAPELIGDVHGSVVLSLHLLLTRSMRDGECRRLN